MCVDASSPEKHQLEVFRKDTDSGKCLNALSECPKRYLKGVVRTYIRRALKTCTSWQKIDKELIRVKRILTDNNYASRDIDLEIQKAVDLFISGNTSQVKSNENTATFKLYYQNQYSSAYKEDERVLKILSRKMSSRKNARTV